MNLPKALLILPDYPFPVQNGYKIKSYNFIQSLISKYDLTVIIVTYKNNNMLDHKDYFNDLTNLRFKFYKISFLEIIFNIFRSILNNEAIQKNLFASRKLKVYLKNNNNYTIVFLSTIRTCLYSIYFNNSKIVIDFIDSIGLNYLTSLTNTNSFLKRKYYKYEAKKLFDYEIHCATHANLSLFVNHLESNIFSNKCNNIYTIPNGVRNDLFSYKKKDYYYYNSITFLGTMNYQPNIDAVIWFITNVIKNLDKKFIFYIIGQLPPKSLQKLAKHNEQIVFTDFVDDPYLLINSSICFVAPMQNGAGIQNKVIEAMALGKIVILSKKAAEPFLFCEHNIHFIISDDPQSIIFYINDIFLHPNKYIEIQKNAKNIINDKYTWYSYNKKFFKILDTLL
jgi:glycosyltransferase involved in cell wall biosynthesis